MVEAVPADTEGEGGIDKSEEGGSPLTAYGMKEDIPKGLDAGCDHHLTKPIRKPILPEKIRGLAEPGPGRGDRP